MVGGREGRRISATREVQHKASQEMEGRSKRELTGEATRGLRHFCVRVCAFSGPIGFCRAGSSTRGCRRRAIIRSGHSTRRVKLDN